MAKNRWVHGSRTICGHTVLVQESTVVGLTTWHAKIEGEGWTIIVGPQPGQREAEDALRVLVSYLRNYEEE